MSLDVDKKVLCKLTKFITIQIVNKIVNIMGTKVDIIAGITLALNEIFNTSRGTWISVKDRSIVKTLDEAGVNKNLSTTLVDVLTKKGLIFAEGQRGGMRYKLSDLLTPDFEAIANEIWEEWNIRKPKNVNKRDFIPPFPKPLPEEKYNPNTVVLKRQIIIPNLGDHRYVIISNRIIEVVIVALKYAGDEHNQITYDIEYGCAQSDGFIPYIILENMLVKDLFETPQAAADYMIRKTIKYIKRRG